MHREAEIERPYQSSRRDVIGNQHITHQRHALAVDSGLHGHARHAEGGSAAEIAGSHAGGLQPHAPVRIAVVLIGGGVVQERLPAQILRRPQGIVSLQQLRAAHGYHHLVHEAIHAHALVVAGAVTHGDVDTLAHQIHQVHGGVQAHIVAGMLAGETIQPRHQPFGAEGRRHGDREGPAIVPGANRLHCLRQAVETLA